MSVGFVDATVHPIRERLPLGSATSGRPLGSFSSLSVAHTCEVRQGWVESGRCSQSVLAVTFFTTPMQWLARASRTRVSDALRLDQRTLVLPVPVCR